MFLVGLIFLWRVATGPPYIVPLSDFGRDLLGADAVRIGVSPYQRVGDLVTVVPGWDLLPQAYDHWVAHPPFAIAIARAWSFVFGVHSESAFRILSWFSFGFVAATLGLYARERYSKLGGFIVAAAVVLAGGLPPDIWYLHGASIAAMGLVGVMALESGERRWLSLVVLGLLVAWRPWLAPLALFLPHRRRVFTDLFIIGGTAAGATLLAAGWLGGGAVLMDWFREALPGNFADVHWWSLNLSLVGSMVPARISSIVFVVASVAAAFAASFVPRNRWWAVGFVVVCLFSPLVWPQYLLNLMPLMVVGLAGGAFVPLVVVLLLLSVGVSGVSPQVAQLSLILVVFYMLYTLLPRRQDAT